MKSEGGVSDFYTGKAVFVTGASGFVGKVLVEKLLRSCPGVSIVYILVREKKGQSPEQRVEEFLSTPVFDVIRKQPNYEDLVKKLRCVPGDVTVKNFGVDLHQTKILSRDIDVIFHIAANVRFDQALKPMLVVNTQGTLNALDFACLCKKLQGFVHVSTSYCQCNETVLEERVYKAPQDPRKVIDLVNWLDEESLQALAPRLMRNSPNTYAYTKCLAEHLVAEYSDKIPVLIARPSTVSATWKEPIPGWIDNLHGPTGLLVGAGKGVIRTLHCDPKFETDVVPVDITVNSLLVLAAALVSAKTQGPLVYNITADKANRINWGDALKMAKRHFYENPFSVCLWYPGGGIKSSYLVHMVCVVLFHFIPAVFIDFLLLLTFNKPFMVRTQKKVQGGLKLLQYYTTRPWYFHNEKFEQLWESLSDADKKTFYSDKQLKNWDEYMLNYILGTRKYCVKESPETIPHARKILKRLYYLDLAKNVLLVSLFLWAFSPYFYVLYDKFEPLIGTVFGSARNMTWRY